MTTADLDSWALRLEELRDGEITTIVSASGACALDVDGDVTGLVQRGHHPPWAIRREAMREYTDFDDPGWPKRTYMRDVPWSIAYPDDPPCDRGPEAIIWELCKRTDPGAIPVTYLAL